MKLTYLRIFIFVQVLLLPSQLPDHVKKGCGELDALVHSRGAARRPQLPREAVGRAALLAAAACCAAAPKSCAPRCSRAQNSTFMACDSCLQLYLGAKVVVGEMQERIQLPVGAGAKFRELCRKIVIKVSTPAKDEKV